MKKNYLEWILITAGSAIVGALAVDAYRKYRAKQNEDRIKAAKPKEIVIIEQL
jgi:uncharacterized membrane protein YebE (DUF533 family)